MNGEDLALEGSRDGVPVEGHDGLGEVALLVELDRRATAGYEGELTIAADGLWLDDGTLFAVEPPFNGGQISWGSGGYQCSDHS